MKATTLLFTFALLCLAVPALAQVWTVDYSTRGDVSGATKFYGDGSYMFLKNADSVTVYRHDAGSWVFYGTYGQAELPASIPAIAFTGGSDVAVAVAGGGGGTGGLVGGGGGAASVAVPELAILRRHVYGPQLGRVLNPPLQHATAWGAVGVLRLAGVPATRRGVHVDLGTVTLDVQEWCSGLVSAKWLLLLGAALCVVARLGPLWALVLLLGSLVVALEANVLRVAAVGWNYEVFGRAPKDALAWAALAFGVTQVLGLGWLGRKKGRAR